MGQLYKRKEKRSEEIVTHTPSDFWQGYDGEMLHECQPFDVNVTLRFGHVHHLQICFLVPLSRHQGHVSKVKTKEEKILSIIYPILNGWQNLICSFIHPQISNLQIEAKVANLLICSSLPKHKIL